MNYMERRGSGFEKIKGDYRKEVNYNESLEPKFYSDNKSFWAMLFNLNYNVLIEKNGSADIGGKIVDIGGEIVDIGGEKVDIGDEKVDIGFMENYLSYIKVNSPTKEKIKILYSKFATHMIFGRTDIAELLDISPTSASVLVIKMYKAGLLEIVAGQGKGKYKFK